ncbi:VOC family protein, partial [Saccharomonospora saliphila]|uniref:VOC family protein n=1 Tax=Saccharomonospora saliphila TaxID=369829 RepID=UPI0012FCF84A
VDSADPPRSARRAHALLAPAIERTRDHDEADLSAVAAPDGTALFFCRTDSRAEGGSTRRRGGAEADDWLSDFILTGDGGVPLAGLTGIDHVALAQPFDYYDEATLFYRAVLGLRTRSSGEFAAPFGLVRTRTVASEADRVRLVLHGTVLRRGSWAPGVPDPQHVAFATDDIVASARAMRERRVPLLSVPDNYYDDLDARVELPAETLAALREYGILYDADEAGEFFHFCTEVLGSRVFFEVVQRVGDYAGYGAANAPVRMAAHRAARRGR